MLSKFEINGEVVKLLDYKMIYLLKNTQYISNNIIFFF